MSAVEKPISIDKLLGLGFSLIELIHICIIWQIVLVALSISLLFLSEYFITIAVQGRIASYDVLCLCLFVDCAFTKFLAEVAEYVGARDLNEWVIFGFVEYNVLFVDVSKEMITKHQVYCFPFFCYKLLLIQIYMSKLDVFHAWRPRFVWATWWWIKNGAIGL